MNTAGGSHPARHRCLPRERREWPRSKIHSCDPCGWLWHLGQGPCPWSLWSLPAATAGCLGNQSRELGLNQPWSVQRSPEALPQPSSGRSQADPPVDPEQIPGQSRGRVPRRSQSRHGPDPRPRADGSEPRGTPPGRQRRGQPRRGGELEAGIARGSPGPRAAVYKRCGVLGRGPVTLARGRGRGGDGGFRSLRRPGLQQLRRRPRVSEAGSGTQGSPRSWDGSGGQCRRPGEAGARPPGRACPAPRGWRADVAGRGRCLCELFGLVLTPRPPSSRARGCSSAGRGGPALCYGS